jgi:hypothetical protein
LGATAIRQKGDFPAGKAVTAAGVGVASRAQRPMLRGKKGTCKRMHAIVAMSLVGLPAAQVAIGERKHTPTTVSRY